MSLKRSLAIGITALMVLAAIASCVGPALAQTGDENVLYIAMQQDMPNFNSFDLASNSVWKKYVLSAWVYESLSGVDPDGNVYPWLATGWVFDEPTLTVTVEIRQGVKFHDGTTLTVDDVLACYKMMRGGGTYSAFLIDAFDANGDGLCSAEEVDGTIDSDSNGVFEGVTKVDETHIKLVMAKSYGSFFINTLGIPIVPKAIWKDHLLADGTHDTLWNTDPKATIGTGAFKYDSGEKNVFRKLVRFEDYWGKLFTTPSGHHTYAQNVDTLYLKLFASLDTAILALKSGQVDHIPWTVTPGYVPDLIANPDTDIEPISDNGYFYLAFNEKREPMNFLKFRKAVSHTIDKETITKRYMGGFGQPGDSAEPPFWADWYNSSVTHYAFDLDDARAQLQAGGFTGIGTSLKLPDGRPVPPLVLLTPPADYDPVRIKAGELIAKNLRTLGVDVVAKPVDFDTLVAKMNAFDYDMLIIGWSLTSDPIGNVFDVLGPKASQNYFGFWGGSVDNPWYNKLGGISTRADAETVALAEKVEELGLLAKGTFDRDLQIMYTKWAQGLLADALPCNVIYYRVNNYAISTKWTGWLPYLGELFHIYSLGDLTKGVTPPPTGDIISILNMPDKLSTGLASDGTVLVINAEGLPQANVDVALTGTGVTFVPASGKTDANGAFAFKVTGSSDGYKTINAKATKGTATFTSTKIVSAVSAVPPTYYLSVSPDKLFLSPGESSVVTLKVTDQAKNPVVGVDVELDEGLLGYGTVDAAKKTTGAGGTATMTYTAPTTLPLNKHLQVRMSLTVTPTATVPVDRINTVTQFLVVKNTAPSDWHFVAIQNIDQYSSNATNATTHLTLKTFDKEGDAIPNEELALTYSNPAALASPTATVTTDASGIANLAITWATGIDTNATQVFVKSRNFPNAVGAGACLLFKGTTIPTETVYGGMTFVQSVPIIDPNSGVGLPFTTMVWDLDGKAPQGTTPVALIIGEPTDGSTAAIENAPAYTYTSLTDYAGIQTTTTFDKASVTSGGYFLSTLMTDAEINTLNAGTYADWAGLLGDQWTFIDPATMKAFELTDGVGHFNLTADALVLSDNVPHVLVVPMAKMGMYVTPDFNNYYWVTQGQTGFKTELVVQRSMKATSPKYSFPDGIMRDVAPGNVSNGEVTIFDQDNSPVAGTGLSAKISVRSPLFPYFKTTAGPSTDVDGKTTFSVEALMKDSKSNPLSNPARQPLYLQGKAADAVNVFFGTEIFNMPVQLYVGLFVTPPMQQASEAVDAMVKAKVVDETGAAVAGLPVSFTIAEGGGTLDAATANTDASGEGVVNYTFPAVPTGEKFIIATLASQVLKLGYGSASAKFSIVNYSFENLPPALSDLSIPDTGYKTENTTWVLTGKATDDHGIAYVKLSLDGGAPVDLTVTANAWSHEFTGLTVGNHTAVLTTEDIFGLTATRTVTFEIKKPTVINQPPVISNISIPATGYKTKETSLTISGKATDDLGIATVNITIDNGAATVLTLTAGSWSRTFTGLAVGTHTVVVKVKDTMGLTDSKTVTFTVEKKETPEEEKDNTMLYVGIAIVIIIVVVLIAMMMMRGGAKKQEEPPKETKEG